MFVVWAENFFVQARKTLDITSILLLTIMRDRNERQIEVNLHCKHTYLDMQSLNNVSYYHFNYINLS